MPSKKGGRSGPRGLSPEEIVRAAIELLEAEGEAGFSVRKVGARVGCDPMAVLYHFGSKEALERAMADALNARIVPVDRTAPWRARLSCLAHQYRGLAARHPRTFPLLLRFWVTGPADWRHAEMTLQAFSDAGFPDRDVVELCFGWYAGVLGLAAAEAGGLLKPATPEIVEEAQALPPAAFPTVARLIPAFADQAAGAAYTRMVDTMLDGIEAACRSRGTP